MEDAVYDSQSLRKFSRIDLVHESAPDATTLLKFRHLLEANLLSPKMFEELNLRLKRRGILICEGTIIDATIIKAPSSMKNKRQERDPEMHQTKKGNEWHFGMKAHSGKTRGDDEFYIIVREHSCQALSGQNRCNGRNNGFFWRPVMRHVAKKGRDCFN